MECLADAVLAADATGTIVFIIAATEALLGYPRAGLLGQPLRVVMPLRMQGGHEAGMRRYLSTRVPKILGKPVRVPALHRDGTEIDIELTVSYFCPQASAPLFVASIRDLRSRIELERQVVAQRRLRAQHVLMTVLASSETFAVAAPRLLQALCQSLQWDVGLFWTIDPRVWRMKLFASWCGPDAALEAFCAQCHPHSFAQGEGLPGSVWASRKSMWRQHIETDGQYLRRHLAQENGRQN
jgi:PAS domain S-box-containing protein